MAEPKDIPVEARRPFAPGDRIAGRYRIVEEAGRGGTAVVYRAHDERLNRTVAVKVAATEEAARRLAREAEIAARVDSPAVVSVYDFVPGDGGADLIVMPYFGATLAAVLRDRGPLPVHEALTITRQIAEALDAAHRAGVVHGDVKPSNVFLRGDRAFLGDFGASPAGGPPAGDGTFFGTPTYLSPEQLQHGRTGPESDCYALGLVLYEALTGRLPFDGEDPDAVAAARLHQDPIPPRRLRPDLPEDVEALVLRALARDPAARYPDAGALAEAVGRLGGRQGSPADAPTVPVQPAEPPPTPPAGPAPSAVPVAPSPRDAAAAPWPALAATGLSVLAGLALLQQPDSQPLGIVAILIGLAIAVFTAALVVSEPPPGAGGREPGLRNGLRARWLRTARVLSLVDWPAATSALVAAGLTYLMVRAWLGDLPAYAAWAGRTPAPGGGSTLLAVVVALGVAAGAARQPWLAAPDRRTAAWLARAGAAAALALAVFGAIWPVPALAVAAAALVLVSLGTARRYAFAAALLAAAAWLPAAPAFAVPVLLALLARSTFVPAWTVLVLPLAVLFIGFSGGPAGNLADLGLVTGSAFDPAALLAPPPSLDWLLDQLRSARLEPAEYWADQGRALRDAFQGVDYLALLWYATVWWIVAAISRPVSPTLRRNAVRVAAATALSVGSHALGASLFGSGPQPLQYSPIAASTALGLLWLLAVQRPAVHSPADVEPVPPATPVAS